MFFPHKAHLAFFTFIFSLLLITCVLDPVDINIFGSGGSVKTKTGSEGTPTDKSIISLTSGKYYMIEEYDKDDDTILTNTYFVTSTGGTTGTFTSIGRLTGTSIYGLKNDYYYKVTSATAFSGIDFPLYDDNDSASPPANFHYLSPVPAAGIILLPSPDDTYFLDISGILALISPDYEEIMSPAKGIWTKNDPINYVSATNIIKLEGEDTITDYVFLKKDGSGTPEELKVLRIEIEAAPIPGTIELTVSFSLTDLGSTITLPPVYQENLQSATPVKISINAPAGTTINNIYYDGSPVDPSAVTTTLSGTDFTVNHDLSYNNYEFLIAGNHTFMVDISTASGIPYSSYFILPVLSNPP